MSYNVLMLSSGRTAPYIAQVFKIKLFNSETVATAKDNTYKAQCPVTGLHEISSAMLALTHRYDCLLNRTKSCRP